MSIEKEILWKLFECIGGSNWFTFIMITLHMGSMTSINLYHFQSNRTDSVTNVTSIEIVMRPVHHLLEYDSMHDGSKPDICLIFMSISNIDRVSLRNEIHLLGIEACVTQALYSIAIESVCMRIYLKCIRTTPVCTTISIEMFQFLQCDGLYSPIRSLNTQYLRRIILLHISNRNIHI